MPGLGALTVYLNANSSGLERGLSKAQGMLKRFAAAAAGYMAVSSLKGLADESLRLAGIQETAENMLTRQLKNTAGMASYTAGMLKKFAADAQNISIYGDEKVMEAQTRLLQMNSVTGEAFDRTRRVALDIASATGQDLTAVMLTLGKALQEPVKGVKQLNAYGTSPDLQNAVEERIAAEGKEAAQLMLLSDLQKRYQGAAEEAANTISGAFTQNQNALGDLKESIGFLIDEIFDVRGALTTSGSWFAKWADYLRSHAGELAFALKSVWIDFTAGALQMYALVAPVINKIVSVIKAAALNIREFFTAVSAWMSGENYVMRTYESAYSMMEEYAKIGKTLDQIERTRQNRQIQLETTYKLNLDRQVEQNLVRGAAQGTEKGMLKAAKDTAKSKFDAPAAILGSQDAWKIIAASAAFKQSAGQTAQSGADQMLGIMQAQKQLGGTMQQMFSAAKDFPAAVDILSSAAENDADSAGKNLAAADNNSAASEKILSAADKMANLKFPDLFSAPVKESVPMSFSDLGNALKTAYQIGDPLSWARQIASRPESFSIANSVAASPQAQKEGWWGQTTMWLSSFFDTRNTGVKNASGLDTPISKEQLANAKQQLTELRSLNRTLGNFTLAPANLGGR